jgi:1-phosphatidylinositol-4-phosphate 5-kinase
VHPGMVVDKNMALKDLDFLEDKIKIKLSKVKFFFSNILDSEEKRMFTDQIHKDCLFFEQNEIIDYSLLVGIHKLSSSNRFRSIKQ